MSGSYLTQDPLLMVLSCVVAGYVIIGCSLYRRWAVPSFMGLLCIYFADPLFRLTVSILFGSVLISPSALLLPILLFGVAFRWSRVNLRSYQVVMLLITLTFLSFSLATVLWSSEASYGLTKLYNLFGRGFMPGLALGVVIHASKGSNFDAFSMYKAVVTLLSVYVFTLLFFGDGTTVVGRISFGGINPIWLARNIAMMISFISVVPSLNRQKKCLAIGLGCVALYLIKARGPVLSLACALIIWNSIRLLNRQQSKVAIVLFLKSFTVGFPMVALLVLLPFGIVGFERYANLLPGDGEVSGDAARFELFGLASDFWFESVWVGNGIGGFASVAPYESLQYPHNVILELLAEVGILGLFLWVVSVAAMGFCSFRIGLLFPFLTGLSFAMMSGDLGGNKWYWIVGLMSVLAPAGVQGNLGRLRMVASEGIVDLRYGGRSLTKSDHQQTEGDRSPFRLGKNRVSIDSPTSQARSPVDLRGRTGELM